MEGKVTGMVTWTAGRVAKCASPSGADLLEVPNLVSKQVIDHAARTL